MPSVRYRAAFPCTCPGIRDARGAVKAFAAEWLSGDELSDFETAVGEALANAFEHGRGKTLDVKCCLKSGRVVVDITEGGPGFFPPAQVAPPKPGAPRGYGMFIMHHMADGVEFLDAGRHIRLSKKLPDRR